jgi:hypothetical protein
MGKGMSEKRPIGLRSVGCQHYRVPQSWIDPKINGGIPEDLALSHQRQFCDVWDMQGEAESEGGERCS